MRLTIESTDNRDVSTTVLKLSNGDTVEVDIKELLLNALENINDREPFQQLSKDVLELLQQYNEDVLDAEDDDVLDNLDLQSRREDFVAFLAAAWDCTLD